MVDVNGESVAGASISVARCLVNGAIDTSLETTQITNSIGSVTFTLPQGADIRLKCDQVFGYNSPAGVRFSVPLEYFHSLAPIVANYANKADVYQVSLDPGVTLETPTGDVDGVNDAFLFTKSPIIVFRNGVNETRLGTIDANTFTFATPPEEGDDIEGLV